MVALIATAIVTAGGCGERLPEPDAEAAAGTEEGGPGAPTPAHYVTTFAFVGAAPSAKRLYVRLTNLTSPSDLARDYAAWLGTDSAWVPLLRLTDTLPVPRAGWRILPSPDLRVRVGERAEIVELGFEGTHGGIRLAPAGIISEWEGFTGQRAFLGAAMLRDDQGSQPGLLYFRRAARPLSLPPSRLVDRIFLLADTLGNGLLIESGAPGTDGPTTAWSWLQGVESSWTDVVLRPMREDETGEEADALGPWRFEIPAAGLGGEIRIGPEPPGAPVLTDPRERVFLLEAELRLDDQLLRFAGLGVHGPLP